MNEQLANSLRETDISASNINLFQQIIQILIEQNSSEQTDQTEEK